MIDISTKPAAVTIGQNNSSKATSGGKVVYTGRTPSKQQQAKKDAQVENKVLEEIVAWENKLSRCERLEEQLKMSGVKRAMAILNSTGNVHAKTMTSVSLYMSAYLTLLIFKIL